MPEPAVEDIRVTRLQIPLLAIDAEVYPAQVIPDTRVATPGCPAFPPGGTTWSVPSRGIATPQDAHEGLENTAWIFGHSRWQGTPDLFFALQDLSVGDELTANGVNRQTGETVSGQRYRVEALYLSDTTSGGAIVYAGSPEEIPAVPTIVLQTSVRERGEGRPWILDRETLLAKADIVVDGDLDDPCKYLLLFVVARAVG
jgi:hypothetical protein